jgi:transcription antitermination factor NusG
VVTIEPVIVLVACRTGSEKTVQAQIKARGMACYCPRYLVNLRHGGLVARELFPSYLFAWVSNQWEFIRNLIGVRDFIRHSGFIYSVDPRIVDALRKREGPTGYIRIDSSFLPGQQVKLKQKEEWAGIYLGLSEKYKARVLFSLLGSDVELELYERDLVTI